MPTPENNTHAPTKGYGYESELLLPGFATMTRTSTPKNTRTPNLELGNEWDTDESQDYLIGLVGRSTIPTGAF